MKEREPNAAIESGLGVTIPGQRQPEDDRVTGGASPVDLLGAPYKGSNNPAEDGPKQEYVPYGLVTAAADAEMEPEAEPVEQPDVAEEKTTEDESWQAYKEAYARELDAIMQSYEPGTMTPEAMREATRRARVAGLAARAAVSGRGTVYKSIFAGGDRSDLQIAIADDYWNKKEQATQEGAVNPKGDGPSAYGALLVEAYQGGDYSKFNQLLELQTPVRQSLKDTLRNRFTDLARWAKGIKAALRENRERLLDAVDALATGVPQLAEVQKAKDVAKEGWQRAKRAPGDILSAAYGGLIGLINKPRQWAQVKIDQGKNKLREIERDIALEIYRLVYRWVVSRVAAAEALKTTVEVDGQTETPATTTADATDNK